MTIPTSGLFGRLFEIRIGRILALSHTQLSSSAKADDPVFQMSAIDPKGRSMSLSGLPHHATSTRRAVSLPRQTQRSGNDEMPLITADRARRGVPAKVIRGNIGSNAANKDRSSSRAR